MTGPPRTPTDPPEEGFVFFGRILAGLLAIPAGFVGVFLVLIAGAVAQDAGREEGDSDNLTQFALGVSAGVLLFVGGFVGLAYAFKARGGRVLLVLLALTVGLLVAWRIGFSQWCSDCGVP